jgi:hypothetical protein
VVVDERLSDVIAFVRRFLEADAALARAALSEPDDDTYLAREREAASFLGPAQGEPLALQETRWAVPGNTSPQATIDVGSSITPAPLFAVARLDRDRPTWIAFAATKRDAAGTGLSDALRIGLVDGELKVVGRAARNPLGPGIEWESAGGDVVPLDAPVTEAELLRPPSHPEHLEWLATKLGR